MQELIKYFEALEARLNAQEERIAALERAIAGTQPQLAEMLQNAAVIKEHLNRMQEILNEGIQVTPDPDVEVELVYPEDEEATVELPQEQPATPEAPAVPETPEIPEPAPEPQPIVAPEPQPVAAPEPQPEPEVRVAEEPKQEAPRAPQQTSLFGTPVSDIRQAVSIGDRFLFQRELFSGNAEKLQQTLTELNGLHSLDEAVAYVDAFGWDKQSPTYELFLNVLRRRFQ